MGSAEIQGELWGKGATDWADLQEPMHEPLWEAMLQAGKVIKGSRVCDIGCGGGGSSVLAAKRGAQVTGLDASKDLVEIARHRLPEGDFRIGDMENLPFEDRSFDAVIAANSVQYSENRIAALRELRRVCSPGGRVVVGLWGNPDKVEFRTFFESVRDALPEPPPGKGPFELSEPGVLGGLCEQAGLVVVGTGEVKCPFVYADFQTFWRANVAAGPVQAALRQVDEKGLMTSVRTALNSHQKPDGKLVFDNAFQYVMATP